MYKFESTALQPFALWAVCLRLRSWLRGATGPKETAGCSCGGWQPRGGGVACPSDRRRTSRHRSLLLLLLDHVHHGDPRRRPFLWPGLFEPDVYYVLDRVVNVRHERYQSEACAAAHMVTAAQASTMLRPLNAGGSCWLRAHRRVTATTWRRFPVVAVGTLAVPCAPPGG